MPADLPPPPNQLLAAFASDIRRLGRQGPISRVVVEQRTVDYTGEWYELSSMDIGAGPPQDEVIKAVWSFAASAVIGSSSKSMRLRVFATNRHLGDIFPLPLANIRTFYSGSARRNNHAAPRPLGARARHDGGIRGVVREAKAAFLRRRNEGPRNQGEGVAADAAVLCLDGHPQVAVLKVGENGSVAICAAEGCIPCRSLASIEKLHGLLHEDVATSSS